MLIKVYRDELDIEQYINVKDIKKYYVILDKDNKDLFTLKIETYDEDYYELAWMITWNCYRYMMQRIALSIKNEDAFVNIFEFQNNFEENTFYSCCNKFLEYFEEDTQKILEKVLVEATETEEMDNLKLDVKACKILNDEEIKKYNNLKETYFKNLKDRDNLLSKYLR